MESDRDEVISFQCSACQKRLKVKAKHEGKQIDCPKCQASLIIPARQHVDLQSSNHQASRKVAPKKRPSLSLDGLSLNAPAISDVVDRKRSSEKVKAEKESKRAALKRKREQVSGPQGKPQPVASEKDELLARAQTTQPADEGTIPFDDEPAPMAGDSIGQPDASSEAASTNSDAPRSLFDEDLNLEELQEDPKLQAVNEGKAVPASPSPKRVETSPAASTAPPPEIAMDGMDELDDQLAKMQSSGMLSPLISEEPEEPEPDPEYRVVCKTCGTAQYVSPSAQGAKIKCPDCFIEFRVPPPPAGWKAKKKKKRKVVPTPDVPLAPPEDLPHGTVDDRRKTRSTEILEKAKQELTDEKIESLYDHDFDTATFFQNTFGFFSDPIVMAQVIGYGVVFSALFAVAQYSALNTEGFFGRGMLLLTVVLAPMIAILFALPMLSGGLNLIESVANKQRRVTEIPSFNMFDNAGEMILIGLAMAASIVPGFLIGAWLGGSGPGSSLFAVAGMLLSTFVLFPIILLSMLDNNSITQPISSSVMKSLTAAAEAWGGYYLKTLMAFAGTLILWLMLLGRSPLLAGIAGATLPLLIFFTCQQIGTLAGSITDYLSFELATPKEDEDEEEQDASH